MTVTRLGHLIHLADLGRGQELPPRPGAPSSTNLFHLANPQQTPPKGWGQTQEGAQTGRGDQRFTRSAQRLLQTWAQHGMGHPWE